MWRAVEVLTPDCAYTEQDNVRDARNLSPGSCREAQNAHWTGNGRLFCRPFPFQRQRSEYRAPNLLPCRPLEVLMAMTFQRNIGMLLLGIWLVLYGLIGVVGTLNLPSPLMAVLALLAGILILVGR